MAPSDFTLAIEVVLVALHTSSILLLEKERLLHLLPLEGEHPQEKEWVAQSHRTEHPSSEDNPELMSHGTLSHSIIMCQSGPLTVCFSLYEY